MELSALLEHLGDPQAYPEDPVYRFLLAGLYKNGRYFEEAFGEYKQLLMNDPQLSAAFVNIGKTLGAFVELFKL